MGKKEVKAAAAPKVEKVEKADKPKKESKKSKKVEEAAPVAAPKKEKKTKESKKSKKAKTPTPEPSSSEESSSDEEESDSDDSSDEEVNIAKDAKKDVAEQGKAPAAEGPDSSDDSDSDSDSSDEEEEPKKAAAPAAAAKEVSDSDSSDDSSDDEEEEKPAAAAKGPNDTESSSDESSSDEEEAKPVTNGKRKAEDEPEAPVKSAKTAEASTASGSCTVFVGQLSWNIDNDWLKSEFESAGTIVNARVQWDHQNNRSKGFGFVDFSTPDEAAKAVAELNGKEIDGRAVKVDIAAGRDDSNKQKTDRRANAFGDKESEPADTLFVGNLPFSANEDSVYELFAQHGDVQSVRLPTDRETGAPKGFGYVSFSSLEQAKAAMEALSGGAEIEGRRLRLDYSGPKPPRPEGDFGNSRGGYQSRGRGGGRGGFNDRGGRGGGRGGRGGFERGGRGGGRGRGAPRGGARTGGIVESAGSKVTFD